LQKNIHAKNQGDAGEGEQAGAQQAHEHAQRKILVGLRQPGGPDQVKQRVADAGGETQRPDAPARRMQNGLDQRAHHFVGCPGTQLRRHAFVEGAKRRLWRAPGKLFIHLQGLGQW
jgi:hypothetical protein